MKKNESKIDLSEISDNKKTFRSYEKELESILGLADTRARVADNLAQFEDRLVESHNHNEFIDVKLARELYVTACALLRICQKTPYVEHVPFSLAAISYFINPKDGNDDTNELDGFEDDRKVLTMVIRQFELEQQIESEIKEMQKNGDFKSA